MEEVEEEKVELSLMADGLVFGTDMVTVGLLGSKEAFFLRAAKQARR